MSALDNIHAIGLLVQAGGAGLIGLLSGLLFRSHAEHALRYWAWAWLALALALTALLVDLTWPGWPLLLQPLYLFGEYVFLYLLVLGCANFASGRRPIRIDAHLLLPALVLASLVPVLARNEFARLFLVQSFVLGLGFMIALWTLWPALRTHRNGPGLRVMIAALGLLILTFLHYLPVFGWHIATGAPLPLTWLKFTSVAHLLFEFVLGFGGAMVVLERLNQELTHRNCDLAMAGERYRDLAERDPLTGVRNRRAFDSVCARLDGYGCVAMIDIDRMKQINDRHGHTEGDRVLRLVAALLRELARNDDGVFRWGGDELLLLLPDMPSALLAERLSQINRELCELSPPGRPASVPLSISYGIAEYRGSAVDVLAALRLADTAMYTHKATHSDRPSRQQVPAG